MNATEVITAIITGDLDSHRDAIIEAIKTRDRVKRTVEKSVALVTLGVGTKVKLRGLSPKYLNGLTGTVQSRRGLRFAVSLDQPELAGSRFGFRGALTVPANCVEVI